MVNEILLADQTHCSYVEDETTLSYQGLEATISERDFSDNVRLNSTTFDAMEQVKNVDRPSQSRIPRAFMSIQRARRKSQFQIYRRGGQR